MKENQEKSRETKTDVREHLFFEETKEGLFVCKHLIAPNADEMCVVKQLIKEQVPMEYETAEAIRKAHGFKNVTYQRFAHTKQSNVF